MNRIVIDRSDFYCPSGNIFIGDTIFGNVTVPVVRGLWKVKLTSLSENIFIIYHCDYSDYDIIHDEQIFERECYIVECYSGNILVFDQEEFKNNMMTIYDRGPEYYLQSAEDVRGTFFFCGNDRSGITYYYPVSVVLNVDYKAVVIKIELKPCIPLPIF